MFQHHQPEWWIAEDLKRMMNEDKSLIWVKGHSGVAGNERADRIAKETALVKLQMHKPRIAIPAGIRQSYPIHTKQKHVE